MQLHFANSTIHLTLVATKAEDAPSPAIALTKPAESNVPPAHGEYWPGQGGYFICTQPALMGLPARHLVFGREESEELAFGPNVDIEGAHSQLDGRSNTAALLASGQEHPAAEWAHEFAAEGFDDFHLPSRVDLLMAYVCAPQLFKKNGWYWSSTQGSRDGAFVQGFEGGSSHWYGKDCERRVRACRWIPLTA